MSATTPGMSADGPVYRLAVPTEVEAVFRAFRSVEFSTLARDGTPITQQVSALYRPARGDFFLTASIGMPNKAYNARRNPRVSLLYSNPTGSGLADTAAVLVQGDASVAEMTTWNDDLAEYWPWLMGMQPASKMWSSSPVTRWLMDWYYMRLPIRVVPRSIRWWPHGDMQAAPMTVEAAP